MVVEVSRVYKLTNKGIYMYFLLVQKIRDVKIFTQERKSCKMREKLSRTQNTARKQSVNRPRKISAPDLYVYFPWKMPCFRSLKKQDNTIHNVLEKQKKKINDGFVL